MFPLNQDDLPISKDLDFTEDGHFPSHNTLDYTPPEYLSLLFTDIGVLTPSGIAEQLVFT
jgi:translation initiation factor 2B subunit (eIF-2B alpha/beta/delta family)